MKNKLFYLQHFSYSLLSITLFAVSIFLQIKYVIIADDTSWLLHVGKRFLSGGVYGKDFFESNPPMSFFIYLPTFILIKIFAISKLQAYYFYLYGMISASLIYCMTFLKTTLNLNKKNDYYYFLIGLILIFTYLPVIALGEREHFIVLFQLPYLLYMSSCLASSRVRSHLSPVLIGILHGLAISIKPFYASIWIFIEIYYAYQKKSAHACWRIENGITIITGLIYLIISGIVTPEFYTHIFPILHKYYYHAIYTSLTSVLVSPASLFFCCISLFYFAMRKHITHKTFIDILWLGSFGAIISFVIQHSYYFYRSLPALSYTSLLSISLLYLTIQQNQIRAIEDKFMALLLLGVIFIFPVHISASINNIDDKQYFSQQDLIAYINKNVNEKNIYFITFYLSFNYKTIDLTPAHSPSAYAHLWPLLAISRIEKNIPALSRSPDYEKDKEMIITHIVSDLQHVDPSYIFLDTLPWPYIKLLSTNKDFKELWKHNHFQGTVAKLAVYKKET